MEKFHVCLMKNNHIFSEYLLCNNADEANKLLSNVYQTARASRIDGQPPSPYQQHHVNCEEEFSHFGKRIYQNSLICTYLFPVWAFFRMSLLENDLRKMYLIQLLAVVRLWQCKQYNHSSAIHAHKLHNSREMQFKTYQHRFIYSFLKLIAK